MLRERLAVRSSSTIHQGILLAAAVLHVVSVKRFVPCVGRLPVARPLLLALGFGLWLQVVRRKIAETVTVWRLYKRYDVSKCPKSCSVASCKSPFVL